MQTPHGVTEQFKIDEAVRQGTIFGTILCGTSTNRLNKMGQPDPLILYQKLEIESPIYVDDILAMGTTKQVERTGEKMNGLEATKKFEFNNKADKTELLMIRNNKKEEEENANVKLRKGKVGATEGYVYLGDKYDRSGKNEVKIRKKMEKSKYMANEIKRKGSHATVGEAAISVRMLLLEMTAKPSLLGNVETWCNITNAEETLLTQNHHKIFGCFSHNFNITVHSCVK